MTFLLVTAGLLVLAVVVFALRYRAPDMSRFDTPRAPLMVQEHEIDSGHDIVVGRLKEYLSKADPKAGVAVDRANMEEFLGREVPAEITPVDVDGIASEWVIAEGADPDRRLLYLHGGAFRVGSPKSHRHITNELSKRAGAAVLAIDYRMQPEHKVIACHEDARVAYRWILQNGPAGPSEPNQVYVAGDSAGGNMTLALIAWARDAGLRAADAAVAFAPLTDFTMSSPSWQTNLETDPFLGPGLGRLANVPRWVVALSMRASAGMPPNHPELSPLFGDLSNLPPTLIQVSSAEMLYDDAQRYINKARHEGSPAELQVWPKLVHVFQGFPEVPEGEVALQLAADFMTGHSSA